MFHYNPELPLALAQEHQSELLKRAEITRLLKETGPGRPGLSARLLLRSGDCLIALGLWLKKRYQAVGQPADTPVLHVG